MYTEALLAEMQHVMGRGWLSFNGLAWGDAEGLELCAALRYAHSNRVSVRSLTCLSLADNCLGDAFIQSLVACFDEGALAGLVTLHLEGNPITEGGMQALAGAVTRGRLPACKMLNLDRVVCRSACVVQEAARRRVPGMRVWDSDDADAVGG